MAFLRPTNDTSQEATGKTGDDIMPELKSPNAPVFAWLIECEIFRIAKKLAHGLS
jgi:hypothetical protein